MTNLIGILVLFMIGFTKNLCPAYRVSYGSWGILKNKLVQELPDGQLAIEGASAMGAPCQEF